MGKSYNIDRKVNTDYVYCYYYRTKNSVGQTLLCECYKTYDPGLVFNFSFCIKNKRRDRFPHDQITGKDGLHSLVWAYNCLKDAIEFLKYRHPTATLSVFGDNPRKRKIYERYLIPLGFKRQYNNNTLILKFK